LAAPTTNIDALEAEFVNRKQRLSAPGNPKMDEIDRYCHKSAK